MPDQAPVIQSSMRSRHPGRSLRSACVRLGPRRGKLAPYSPTHIRTRRRVAAERLLDSPPDGNLPSKQEKVATAKRAPIGPKDPVKSSFGGISDANTSKLDRSAMWTAYGEHSSPPQRLVLDSREIQKTTGLTCPPPPPPQSRTDHGPVVSMREALERYSVEPRELPWWGRSRRPSPGLRTVRSRH
jgi:hypothetical protein